MGKLVITHVRLRARVIKKKEKLLKLNHELAREEQELLKLKPNL